MQSHWDGQKKQKPKKSQLELSPEEAKLILMYREIEVLTFQKISNYSYFNMIYKTTEELFIELRRMKTFPEAEELKAEALKRMENNK